MSRIVFDSVHSYLLPSADSTRLAADSLWILASIVERSPELVSTKYELDERLFVSLCFGPSVSARTWLLKNAEKFRIGSYLLFSVFFGFTKDPYPYVREAALDGLVGLSKSTLFEDHGMIKGCSARAVELLRDMEDCVRSAAVRAVTAWGLMLVESSSSIDQTTYLSREKARKMAGLIQDSNTNGHSAAAMKKGGLKLSGRKPLGGESNSANSFLITSISASLYRRHPSKQWTIFNLMLKL